MFLAMQVMLATNAPIPQPLVAWEALCLIPPFPLLAGDTFFRAAPFWDPSLSHPTEVVFWLCSSVTFFSLPVWERFVVHCPVAVFFDVRLAHLGLGAVASPVQMWWQEMTHSSVRGTAFTLRLGVPRAVLQACTSRQPPQCVWPEQHPQLLALGAAARDGVLHPTKVTTTRHCLQQPATAHTGCVFKFPTSSAPGRSCVDDSICQPATRDSVASCLGCRQLSYWLSLGCLPVTAPRRRRLCLPPRGRQALFWRVVLPGKQTRYSRCSPLRWSGTGPRVLGTVAPSLSWSCSWFWSAHLATDWQAPDFSWNPGPARGSDPRAVADHVDGPWRIICIQEGTVFVTGSSLAENFHVAVQHHWAVLFNKTPSSQRTRVFRSSSPAALRPDQKN